MLDIVIIVLLVMGFFVGLKRGFILQLFHLIGFIVAYIVANLYFEQLAPKLILWIPYPNFNNNQSLKILTGSGDMETAFYRAVAFALIFFAVKIVMQIIASMLDFIAQLPILKQLNFWAGGLLGFLENYLLIFILLYFAALIPIAMFQDTLDHSTLAKAIVNHTPVFSEQIKRWWIQYSATTTSL
jgi:uncharacterized membrane protein required for colicin V production